MLVGASIAVAPNASIAQSINSWISTSSATWSTAGNWSLGVAPATAPISVADYPGTATLQHALDLAGATGRVSYGHQFDFLAGGVGYVFNGTAGSVSGLFIRAGGPINGGAGGIVNNDDNAQTFNVPVKLTSSNGIAGAASAMTFNAALGDLIFNGNNNAPATPWTINLNGATALTFTGPGNITIGSSGAGQIVNTNVGTFSGLIKNGSGTLTLGGTNANTFVGTNVINSGSVLAAKANALGSGNALTLAGGGLNSGGLNQALGTLSLGGSAFLDFGSGASAVSFANSAAFNWGGFSLTLSNWTSGSDTLRFGTDATGLTGTQLGEIIFADLPGSPTGQIDSAGYVTPYLVPEPSTVALGAAALLSLVVRRRSRSSRA